MRTARLFVTHVWSSEIEKEFVKIRGSSTSNSDSWLLLNARTSCLCELVKHNRCHVFDIAVLAQLPYFMRPRQSLIGHGHLPILDFIGFSKPPHATGHQCRQEFFLPAGGGSAEVRGHAASAMPAVTRAVLE